ncbi:C-type lectin domain family 2 member B-like isoform X3 [Hypanus sabinus]|uniref:C-type lectin domain family 2 member B-like isoform X3 n=1 Tax=Hypanus sabinus TaxID=79690 RepID=UPI0028C4E146|nr:C-type lectin domain family 2 member B-like isoform X3 [Hypanus sabinus]
MDGGKTNVYVKFAKTHPQSPSNDDPTSTYSELNFTTNETLIDEDEDPLSASGPGELPVTAQTGNMGSERPRRRDRSGSSLWLIFLLTASLISMGICWRIHEQTCSKDWITYKERCYYVSTFETSFRRAVLQCSKRDSRLLEISSSNEANFVFRSLAHQNVTYWIGKCENGLVAWRLLYNVSSGTSDCRDCYSYPGGNPCDSDRRFICEKSAPLFPDIPEKIQDLCLMPLEGT